MTILNSDITKISAADRQACGEKAAESQETTLASLIHLFNFICTVKKQFEHPLTEIKMDIAQEIIDLSPKYSTEEKKVIEKLDTYVGRINWVRENFQISVFRHDAFHFKEFEHNMKVFPSWNANKIRIYLNINDQNTTYSARTPNGEKTECLNPFKPDLDKITNILTTQFGNNLDASFEANGVMSSIIELLKNKSDKSTAKTRKDLFDKFEGILNKLNDVIGPADELDTTIISLFTNIGAIAGSVANLLHQICNLEHRKYFLKKIKK